MIKHILVAALLIIADKTIAQTKLYNPSIDVQHYEFNIQLSDSNDTLSGRAIITVQFTKSASTVQLDLININDTGRGMMVTDVRENNQSIAFTHKNDLLSISLQQPASFGQVRKFEIIYKGIPADGLIISKNKFAHRTIFADNWPNRARNWIPCKDHLSDKAAVDFIVTAPDHYQVVANGIKVEEKPAANGMLRTHWKEEVPLPTKIMVIGVADFAVDNAGTVNNIPVSSWIFPEQKEKGFHDYAQAVEILPFFINHVGPYAYKKLANVQSKTIFGGMENAGAIFYSESSVTGTRKSEGLFAHEIAHQWFGDAATETDWPHIWLSEGFATEMTHLYLESKYGRDTLVKSLQADRRSILSFTKKKKVPVVDTSAGKDIMQLLNTNSYQKGGWILHMLRTNLGDSVFWKSIRQYYAMYRGKNASTEDLQKILENVSGKNLDTFFKQWCYVPENPTLLAEWSYNEKNKKIILRVTQQTNTLFTIPLEIQFTDGDGKKNNFPLTISAKTNEFSFEHARPASILLDPGCKLLFEGTVKGITN